ncbi:hypothetical protein VN97_g2566 [Penicillium thymicola]|uniref:Uncharacterized protein n=1 Tax=Penicillium thymicola TaxID=293382 RepID=A0AAI9XB04_PENTH|nr:hypothetical protein VN97_g2566 [Penicillium thymicola]
MIGYTENLVASKRNPLLNFCLNHIYLKHKVNKEIVAKRRILALDDHQLELLMGLRERHTIRAYREEAIRDEELNHTRRMPNRRALCGNLPQSIPSLHMDL